jgi:Uma2 family endonuclease
MSVFILLFSVKHQKRNSWREISIYMAASPDVVVEIRTHIHQYAQNVSGAV